MDDSVGLFNTEYREIINLEDAFDLLLEDNKDILEEIQEELHFTMQGLKICFVMIWGFSKSDFYNWNKAKSVIEFLDSIDLYPLILIDNPNFTLEKYIQVIESFLEYFDEIDYIDISNFKFQFTRVISKDIKDGLITFISSNYNINLIEEDFISDKNLNKIYDTIYMLPFYYTQYYLSKKFF